MLCFHRCRRAAPPALTPFLTFLRLLPIERLLPPRLLRGEKVAKPDEGGVERWDKDVLSERDLLEKASLPGVSQHWRDGQTPPSSGLQCATFSPTEERRGKGARLRVRCRQFQCKCEKC